MAAPYNLTAVDESVGIIETIRSLSDLAPGYVGNFLLLATYVIMFTAMTSLNISPRFAMFAASLSTTIGAILLFYFGLVSSMSITILIGVTIASALWLAAVGGNGQ